MSPLTSPDRRDGRWAWGCTLGWHSCCTGVAGVTAAAAVRKGRAVKAGGTAGQVAELPEQAVDEGGAAQHTLHPNEKVGVALEDIAAGAIGDVFVGA